MGLFGGDKKDKGGKKRLDSPAADSGTSSRRKSRRIVTPGSAPREDAGRDANLSRRPRPSAPPAPKPPPAAAAGAVAKPRSAPAEPEPRVEDLDDDVLDLDEPFDLADEMQAVVPPKPAAPPASSSKPAAVPPPPRAKAPAVSRDQGKQPIDLRAAGDLEFGGDLVSGAGASGVHRGGDRPLLHFLVDKSHLLSQEQGAEAKAMAEREALPLDVACSRLGYLEEERLVSALTDECWVPHLKVNKYDIRKKALDTISEHDARRYGVLPVDKLGSILNLAMVNPLDTDAIHDLENKTGLDIKKVVATRAEIEAGIARYYGGEVAASEGSMSIAQDRESRRVTTMLSRMPVRDDSPLAEPVVDVSKNETVPAPVGIMPELDLDHDDEIADIDDLLEGDEEVAPSVIEAVSLDADDIELVEDDDPELIEDIQLADIQPEVGDDFSDEFDDQEPAIEPALASPTPLPADLSDDFELEPTYSAAALQAAPEPELLPSDAAPDFDFELDEEPAVAGPSIRPPPMAAPEPLSFPQNFNTPSTPQIKPLPPAVVEAASKPQPATAPKAPKPAPPVAPPPLQPVAAKPVSAPAVSKPSPRRGTQPDGMVSLVPVVEENFQHAISHGKSRLFEKWVSLQTRNRILNAVSVEAEMDELLQPLYEHGDRIAS